MIVENDLAYLLGAALRPRDRQLCLSAQEERQIAQSSTEPPLNFNSREGMGGNAGAAPG